MSAFEKWFKEQHGMTPMPTLRRLELEEKRRRLLTQIAKLDMALRADEAISFRWTSALWAWNAARPTPKEKDDGR